MFKKDGNSVTYAIVDYKDDYRLAIPIDYAVYLKELVSAEGNTNDQTVTLTYLVSHKMVHQNVCLAPESKSKLFDYNGNEYNAKKVIVANENNKSTYVTEWMFCNKIPTNVPVKLTVNLIRFYLQTKSLVILNH